MSVFTSLSKDVLQRQVYVYLTLPELGCLCVAITNKVIRDFLSMTLRGFITNNHVILTSDCMLHWILKYEINVVVASIKHCISKETLQYISQLRTLLSLKLYGYISAGYETPVNMCKYQYDNNPRILRKLDLSSVKGAIDPIFSILTMNCLFLMEVNLSDCSELTDNSIRELCGTSLALHSINLTNCHKLSDEALRCVCINGGNILNLNLHSCVRITNRGILTISERCPNLHTLCVCCCIQLSDESLVNLGNFCKNLQSLNISFCHMFTSVGVTALASQCTDLHTLDLTFCPSITESCVAALTTHCHRLSTALFGFSIPSSTLKLFVESCRRLHTIDLSNADVTDEDIQLLVQQCSLRDIDLSHCANATDEALLAIARRCPALNRLILSETFMVTSASLFELSRCCKLLCELALNGCPDVPEDGLMAVCKACPQLHTLSISDNENVTDEFIRTLVDSCPLMRFLCVTQCSMLTDAAVDAIVQGCRQLTTLDISECDKMTSGAVLALSGASSSLTSLDVSFLEVSNEAFAALCGQCRSLAELQLAAVDELLPAVLHTGLNACVSLQLLGLYDCGEITDEVVRLLATGDCPQLRRLELRGWDDVSTQAILSRARPDIHLVM